MASLTGGILDFCILAMPSTHCAPIGVFRLMAQWVWTPLSPDNDFIEGE